MSTFMRSGYAIDTPLHARFVSAHTQLGAVLLRRWRTPEEIATVAARHHAKSMFSESLASIAVFLADHLHRAVLEHDRAAFDRPQRSSTGCFGGATEAITAALSALGLDVELEAMIARVADECRAIEILTAAVYSGESTPPAHRESGHDRCCCRNRVPETHCVAHCLTRPNAAESATEAQAGAVHNHKYPQRQAATTRRSHGEVRSGTNRTFPRRASPPVAARRHCKHGRDDHRVV